MTAVPSIDPAQFLNEQLSQASPDLMRDLRATDARRHVREETPFFTGPRVTAAQLTASLP